MKLTLEWDETKRLSNIEKHGLDFADVADLDWRNAKTKEDTRFPYPQRRYVSTVPNAVADMFIVVFCIAGPTRMRVISFRGASKKEIADYG